MLAAQGQGKDMKKWVEQWKPYLDEYKDAGGGADAFVRKYGSGI